MCKVGGPRCAGSNTVSARQSAQRKASKAYHKAVAERIAIETGREDFAERILAASATDMHDIAEVTKFDVTKALSYTEPVAYTDNDGVKHELVVTPTGSARRSPMSAETRQLLVDLDEHYSQLSHGPLRDALLNGDRKAAAELRSRAAEDVAVLEKSVPGWSEGLVEAESLGDTELKSLKSRADDMFVRCDGKDTDDDEVLARVGRLRLSLEEAVQEREDAREREERKRQLAREMGR